MPDPRIVSSLFEYLPAIYREDYVPEDSNSKTPLAPDRNVDAPNTFLNSYLLAFEQILLGLPPGSVSGNGAEMPKGLEQTVDALANLINADAVPDGFVDWLAQWVSLSFNVELSAAKKRMLIAMLVPFYKLRGTKYYVETLLRMCLETSASVDEPLSPEFQIGVNSTVGKDSYLGGSAPNFFRVTIALPATSAEAIEHQRRTAASIIEFAKPAHTQFEIKMIYPRIQIGVHSTIAVDMLLP